VILSTIDIVVFVAFYGLVLGVSLWKSRGRRTTEDYFLGGRRLPWWLIEGHGVLPDIVVDNLPRATFDGKDEQLDAAIRHLEERIREEPIEDLPPPAFPRRAVE